MVHVVVYAIGSKNNFIDGYKIISLSINGVNIYFGKHFKVFVRFIGLLILCTIILLDYELNYGIFFKDYGIDVLRVKVGFFDYKLEEYIYYLKYEIVYFNRFGDIILYYFELTCF